MCLSERIYKTFTLNASVNRSQVSFSIDISGGRASAKSVAPAGGGHQRGNAGRSGRQEGIKRVRARDEIDNTLPCPILEAMPQ